MPAKAPETIRFNAIDRYYLIPETDDLDGVYFPMTIGYGVELRQPINRAQIIKALGQINARVPQFRLGYRLDHRADCWRRVPDAELDKHFAAMVLEGDPGDLDDLISETIRTNVTPMALPLQINTHGQNFVLKIQHSFGDGRLMIKLMAHLILATFDPAAYAELPDVNIRYPLPIWRIVWNSPQQGFKTLSKWLQTFSSSVQDYRGSGETVSYTPEPIHSGSPMRFTRIPLSREIMTALNRLRKSLSPDVRISLNTLMQVLLAHRLIELGILPANQGVICTQPIDLRRYLKDQTITYAGNLAGQIRRQLPARSELDLRADCLDFQQWIDVQTQSSLALATLPSEWLLALAGKRFYKKVNRDWLIKSIKTDPRYFVFSNLGPIDSDMEPIQPFIKPGTSLAISVSLMGGPPLIVGLALLDRQGHVCVVYNPRVLDADQVTQIMQVFSLEHIESQINDAMVL